MLSCSERNVQADHACKRWQWLWHSWWSSHFRIQRSDVRFPPSSNYPLNKIHLQFKMLRKMKLKGKSPMMSYLQYDMYCSVNCVVLILLFISAYKSSAERKSDNTWGEISSVTLLCTLPFFQDLSRWLTPDTRIHSLFKIQHIIYLTRTLIQSIENSPLNSQPHSYHFYFFENDPA